MFAGTACTGTCAELTFSSGMEMESDGDLIAAAERTKSVTLTFQGADSFGSAMGVWPTFDISREDSSMKTGLDEETRSGCVAGVVDAFDPDVDVGRVTRKAGL